MGSFLSRVVAIVRTIVGLPVLVARAVRRLCEAPSKQHVLELSPDDEARARMNPLAA